MSKKVYNSFGKGKVSNESLYETGDYPSVSSIVRRMD